VLMVAGAGLAHILRARSNIFENKFSRVDCLAKCRMALFTCDLFSVADSHPASLTKIKTLSYDRDLILVALVHSDWNDLLAELSRWVQLTTKAVAAT